MDNENENVNETGSQHSANAPVPNAPYYKSNPSYNQSQSPVQPSWYSTSAYQADPPTPWRDPEYHPATNQNGNVYSPTAGYYSYSAYRPDPTSSAKAAKEKGSNNNRFRNILIVVLVCIAFSAITTGTVLWIHDSIAKDKNVNADLSVPEEVITDRADTDSGENSSKKSNPAIPTPDYENSKASETQTSEHSSFTSTTDVTVTGNVLSATQIYDLACEQVVGINLSVTSKNIFEQTTSTACSGTGFVISENGYILTCYHVIEYSLVYGYDISVLLYDESEYPATLVGYDEDGDLAVLKIDVDGMNPVTIGNSGELRVGEAIYAVGNPLGELTYTMTDGIVSALNREISTSISSSLYVFQINAAVNSGNSGGPVYNDRGMVVGIVDAKYADTGVEGLSFALPIDSAYKAALEIIEKGYVSGKAYLGITGQTVESFAKRYYNIPDGVIVASVESGSAAEKAGIQAYDIITSINGEDILNMSDLQSALRKYAAGDEVVITIYRSSDQSASEYIDLTVVLGEKIPTAANG